VRVLRDPYNTGPMRQGTNSWWRRRCLKDLAGHVLGALLSVGDGDAASGGEGTFSRLWRRTYSKA